MLIQTAHSKDMTHLWRTLPGTVEWTFARHSR